MASLRTLGDARVAESGSSKRRALRERAEDEVAMAEVADRCVVAW